MRKRIIRRSIALTAVALLAAAFIFLPSGIGMAASPAFHDCDPPVKAKCITFPIGDPGWDIDACGGPERNDSCDKHKMKGAPGNPDVGILACGGVLFLMQSNGEMCVP